MSKVITNEMKTSIIRVTSFEDLNLKGTFSNSYFDKDKSFLSLTQLLILINILMEELSFPQRVTEQRNFGANSKNTIKHFDMTDISDATENKHATIASFALTVKFRQAASWQGQINCLETGTEKEFVSDLDMLSFMLDVLQSRK